MTGQSVVRKTDTIASALTEARCLLSLPPGVGPKLIDIAWRGSGGLVLFLERLSGKTLDAARGEVPPKQVPGFARELCETLSDLHRAGWIHADLKPENIFLLGQEGFDARLLDFGFAINRFGLLEPNQYGGTPPFMAPELQRGWIADERADLYSLGAILQWLLPSLPGDAKWAPILDRLGARIPGERYSDARTASDAISKAFGLERPSGRLPRFGSGPMVGREPAIQRVLEALRSRPGVRLLVQGRPGTGISRFLMESVLAVASSKGPGVRMVDLSGMADRESLDRGIGHLRDLSTMDGAVLCGIDDPSPGLRWMDGLLRDRLIGIISDSHWERIDLPPLDVGSYQEIVGASLGRASTESDRLGEFLHTTTEGDLHSAREAFVEAIRASGQEEGLGWSLDAARLQEALADWRVSAESELGRVPIGLVDSLVICARAGATFSEVDSRALLDQFADSGALTVLIDHEYLRGEGAERLRFDTRRLWGEALSVRHEREQEVDRWINARFDPDPDRIDDVLHLALLARRLGDAMKESTILSKALARAHGQRRWSDVLRLLSYPGTSPTPWTVESALRQIAELRKTLGSEWTEGRLLAIAGSSLKGTNTDIWMQLLERVAEGPDVDASVEALIGLASGAANKRSGGAYERYRKMLGGRDRGPHAIPPGVLDFLDARHAMACGRPGDALRLAVTAVTMLRGSGLIYESLGLQLLAILQSEDEPGEAAATLEAALKAATDPELRAQIQHNLALLYGLMGRFGASAECTDSGIHLLDGRVSPARLAGLRTQRAWSWADLDLAQRAQPEASALLSMAVVRNSLQRLVPVRLLLGYCYLHRGSGSQAIGEIARAWIEARAAVPAELQAECLRLYVDTLLDLGEWDLVRDHGIEFGAAIAGQDRAITTTNARARALLVEAEGRPDEALTLLEGQLGTARELRNRLAAARYLHHLGLVCISLDRSGSDQVAAAAAVRFLDEELDVLVTPGHAYYRGQALLALSIALRLAGNTKEALKAINTAISLARSIKSRRLVDDCLESRMVLRADRS